MISENTVPTVPTTTMPSTGKTPHAMSEKISALTALADAFCERHLDDEYWALIHRLIGALASNVHRRSSARRASGLPRPFMRPAGSISWTIDHRLTADGYLIYLVYLKLFEKIYAPLTSGIAWRGRRGMAEDRGRGTRKGQADYRVCPRLFDMAKTCRRGIPGDMSNGRRGDNDEDDHG